jgi:hypothetical protein
MEAPSDYNKSKPAALGGGGAAWAAQRQSPLGGRVQAWLVSCSCLYVRVPHPICIQVVPQKRAERQPHQALPHDTPPHFMRAAWAGLPLRPGSSCSPTSSLQHHVPAAPSSQQAGSGRL